MHQRSTNASPAMPRSRHAKAFVLIAVILACVSLPLSLSAGPAAQTFIGHDLAGGTVALSWITNAFMLACGSTLMVAGALADHYGRKKIFFIGMLVMTIVSLVMPLALPTAEPISIQNGQPTRVATRSSASPFSL